MIRAGIHHNRATGQEWLVLAIRATRPLATLHGACFIGTHLVRFMSGLPLPRGLYLAFHDLTEPRLRRWCEQHPLVL